jgi:acetolactate decarboxylase
MKSTGLLLLVMLMQNLYAQSPFIKVLDTDFSKGRLTHQQTITLDDAAKLHGHLCDGMAVGFLGLREALYNLYPDSIVDRTNTRIVSKPSPCLTDIAIYLTGGRYQFNTFYVSDSIQYAFIVQRIDNEKTYAIKLKPGVKPAAIDSLGKLANMGKLAACELDLLRKMEDDFTIKLLASKPTEIFTLTAITNFIWHPFLQNNFLKTDIQNKQLKPCN